MSDIIRTIADLEACLGPAGLGVHMKQIDFLDDGAKRWMAASPLAFVGTAGISGLSLTLAGGRPGFLSDAETGELILPIDALDDNSGFVDGTGVGILLLIPGITETMRINGRVRSTGSEVRIAVDEVYVHCGKALIRSEFWAAQPAERAMGDVGGFLAQTRFMALATADAAGRTDVSPKGDPAGAMVRLSGDHAIFPDRPGNRRADGFRNMMDRPQAISLALVPGSNQVAWLAGSAEVTRDPDICAPLSVDGKIPQLVTRLGGAPPALRQSRALERARLWPIEVTSRDDVDPSAILVAHIKLNRTKGEQADQIRGIVQADAVRKDLGNSPTSTRFTESAGMSEIATVAELEACIGPAPLGVKMKVIDHIDLQAKAWIARAPLAFVGLAGPSRPTATLAGGPAGYMSVHDDGRLIVSQDCLDHRIGSDAVGQGIGVLVLVPGIGETLRVNGVVADTSSATAGIAVQECYVHCAKALIRSCFWQAAPLSTPFTDSAAFVDAARFIALVTADAGGQADVSPKGDPAGAMLKQQRGEILFADRPGNRRVDSFRNIVSCSRMAAVALVPGSDQVAIVSGRARLVTDEALRAAFDVGDKTPKLVTCVTEPEVQLYPSKAVQRAAIWPVRPVTDLDPAAAMVAHVKLNKTRGLSAVLLRTAANRSLLTKGLAYDYKKNLY